jgi:hypothetical protein
MRTPHPATTLADDFCYGRSFAGSLELEALVRENSEAFGKHKAVIHFFGMSALGHPGQCALQLSDLLHPCWHRQTPPAPVAASTRTANAD